MKMRKRHDVLVALRQLPLAHVAIAAKLDDLLRRLLPSTVHQVPNKVEHVRDWSSKRPDCWAGKRFPHDGTGQFESNN